MKALDQFVEGAAFFLRGDAVFFFGQLHLVGLAEFFFDFGEFRPEVFHLTILIGSKPWHIRLAFYALVHKRSIDTLGGENLLARLGGAEGVAPGGAPPAAARPVPGGGGAAGLQHQARAHPPAPGVLGGRLLQRRIFGIVGPGHGGGRVHGAFAG